LSQSQPAGGVPVCYRHPDREAHIRCQRCNRVICPDCMRPASVGFQCPECVAEGAKQTRQNRTTYGGLRPTDASKTSFVLIALNAAVWVAILATGASSSRLVDLLALRAKGVCGINGGAYAAPEASCSAAGGSWYPGVTDGAVWQLVTTMFTHVEVLHIGFNMLALYALGPSLEVAIGRSRFLALYFISGLAGSALVMWAGSEYGATLGASGAIFGLMGALAVIALKTGGDVRGILTWIAINFVLTVVVANISWQGHLGGFLGGVAVAAVLVLVPRGPRRTQVQILGLTGIAVLVALAIAVRVAMLAG
jgi:membrane associated rhomboid family serine protease